MGYISDFIKLYPVIEAGTEKIIATREIKWMADVENMASVAIGFNDNPSQVIVIGISKISDLSNQQEDLKKYPILPSI